MRKGKIIIATDYDAGTVRHYIIKISRELEERFSDIYRLLEPIEESAERIAKATRESLTTKLTTAIPSQ